MSRTQVPAVKRMARAVRDVDAELDPDRHVPGI